MRCASYFIEITINTITKTCKSSQKAENRKLTIKCHFDSKHDKVEVLLFWIYKEGLVSILTPTAEHQAMPFVLLINVKMPTNVDISQFMTRTNDTEHKINHNIRTRLCTHHAVVLTETSVHDVGLVARKPGFVACKQQRRRPACALRSLISACDIRCMERTISTLATCKMSTY